MTDKHDHYGPDADCPCYVEGWERGYDYGIKSADRSDVEANEAREEEAEQRDSARLN